jgi:hypothetical protein
MWRRRSPRTVDLAPFLANLQNQDSIFRIPHLDHEDSAIATTTITQWPHLLIHIPKPGMVASSNGSTAKRQKIRRRLLRTRYDIFLWNT